MITTGELAERQIDVESDGVEAEEEGEEEILNEVTGQDTTSASSLGSLEQVNMRKKSWRNLTKNSLERVSVQVRPQTRTRQRRRSRL